MKKLALSVFLFFILLAIVNALELDNNLVLPSLQESTNNSQGGYSEATFYPVEKDGSLDILKKRDIGVRNLGGGSSSAICRLGNDPFSIIFDFIPNQNFTNLPNIPPHFIVGELHIEASNLINTNYLIRFFVDYKDPNEPLYFGFEKVNFLPRFIYGILHTRLENAPLFFDTEGKKGASVTIPVKKEDLFNTFYIQAIAYNQKDIVLSDGYAVTLPLTPSRFLVDKNTVAFWHFDENKGNVAFDSTANHNDGQIIGATWTQGITNGALTFNGVDNYVLVPSSNSFNLVDNITIEAYIKIENTLKNDLVDYIIGKDAQHVMGIGDNLLPNNFTFGFGNQPVTLCAGGTGWCNGGGPISLNEWHDVAVQYDGETIKTFIDGTLTSAYKTNFKINIANLPLGIGARPTGGGGAGGFFKGKIDEVRISNIARY